MKHACCILFYALLAVAASAQNIILKDGQVVAARDLHRQGDTITATINLSAAQPGQPAATGKFGYPLAQIERIDFPEPPEIKAATDLLASGKAADALVKIEPVMHTFEEFHDAPGSWWTDAAFLDIEALAALGRDDDAEKLAGDVARTATDPETIRTAKIYAARGIARKGDTAKAIEAYDAVLKDATDPRTIALADVAKGQACLARKDWENGLLSFLDVPVFHPRQKMMMPRALLGAADAYIGLEDLQRARASLNQLVADYPSSSEAAQAKVDLAKIDKLERPD